MLKEQIVFYYPVDIYNYISVIFESFIDYKSKIVHF